MDIDDKPQLFALRELDVFYWGALRRAITLRPWDIRRAFTPIGWIKPSLSRPAERQSMPPPDPNCISPWVDFVKMLPSVVTMVTAIIGTRYLIKGFDRWRAESTGKRKFELAEQVLADFYEARDVLRWVRFDRGHEEHDDEAPMQEAYSVPIERLQSKAEFFGAMEARKYRFEALFGADALVPFNELAEAKAEINVAARSLRHNRSPQTAERFERIIGWTFTEHDEIQDRIDGLVAKIEHICKDAIKAQA